MFDYFHSFLKTTVSIPVYPPYYEISDKSGNLLGCISGTHHHLSPNAHFEPAPSMLKCFDRATTIIVESDKEAAKEELKKQWLRQGVPLVKINEHFKKADSINSIDMVWERRAKMQNKKIKGLESTLSSLQTAAKVHQEDEKRIELFCKPWKKRALNSVPEL